MWRWERSGQLDRFQNCWQFWRRAGPRGHDSERQGAHLSSPLRPWMNAALNGKEAERTVLNTRVAQLALDLPCARSKDTTLVRDTAQQAFDVQVFNRVSPNSGPTVAPDPTDPTS